MTGSQATKKTWADATKTTEPGRKEEEEDNIITLDDSSDDEIEIIDTIPVDTKKKQNDDTPKSKKGGRPKKKGLDDQFEEVEKLGSNMYFYTGPGGSRFPISLRFYKIFFTSYKFLLILLIFTSGSPPPYNDSDEEDLPIKKENAAPARKSGRANKGLLKYFEKGFRTNVY